MSKIKPACEHIDYDNKRDCEENAEVMCMCCAVPMCREHGYGNCQFGGMGFIELPDNPKDNE